MAKRKEASNAVQRTEEMDALLAATGRTANSPFENLDGALLSMVVQAVTRKSAQIALGTDKSGAVGVITLWDKGFPYKQYVRSDAEATKLLAQIADAYLPRTAQFDEWRKYLREFDVNL